MVLKNNNIHSGYAYIAFDKIINIFEKKLKKNVIPFGCYDSNTILERLVQRIVELTLNPYVYYCNVKLKEGVLPFSEFDNTYIFSGLKLDIMTGEINVKNSLFLRSLAEFTYEWFEMLVSIVSGFNFSSSKNSMPATLLFGLGDEMTQYKGTDKRFVEFCKNSLITPLKKAKRLIIQNKENHVSFGVNYMYSNRPVNKLVSSCYLTINDRLNLLMKHFLNPFNYFIAIIRFPLISIVSRDVALIPVINFLDKKKLIQNILITNSNCTRQPLWMRMPVNRNFKVHEIFYSQNTKPVVYSIDKLKTDIPVFRHTIVDERWVWTDGYKEYLEKLGKTGPIHVIGSIMFYLPCRKVSNKSNDVTIGVFDITPVYSKVADKIGIINNYYSAEIMTNFLKDIVMTCKEIEVISNKKIRIQLKHKRYFHKSHDMEYIDYCKQLAIDEDIEIVDYDINVYQFVSGCSAVISVPYTSAAYIACEMGVPSIYYDSTDELLPDYEHDKNLTMLSNKISLSNKLINTIMN